MCASLSVIQDFAGTAPIPTAITSIIATLGANSPCKTAPRSWNEGGGAQPVQPEHRFPTGRHSGRVHSTICGQARVIYFEDIVLLGGFWYGRAPQRDLKAMVENPRGDDRLLSYAEHNRPRL
jgi:hypothetical protein